MEKYKFQEKLETLKTQNEDALLRFGVEIDSLPEDIKSMLDMCVETQILTGLHKLDELYLKEFYLQKRRELVDNKLSANKMQVEIDNLKNQIKKETAECDILLKFINQNTKSEEGSEINAVSLLDTKIQSLQSKLDQIHLPENLDFEELMKKIEILKSRESEGKK